MASPLIMTQQIGAVVHVFILEMRIVDENRIKELGEKLSEIVDGNVKVKMLVDFAKVEYLSSAMLGRLVALHKKVKEANGVLKLCAIKPQIEEIFKITKLNKVFDIYAKAQDAMKDFKTKVILSSKRPR